MGSVLGVERDGVVVAAKVRSIGAHENVTNDNVVETFRHGHGHDAHKALGLATRCDLDDVILLSENVLLIINFEGDIGEQVDTFTSLVDFDTCNDWVNDFGRSNDKGSAGVNGSFDAGGFLGTVRSGD